MYLPFLLISESRGNWTMKLIIKPIAFQQIEMVLIGTKAQISPSNQLWPVGKNHCVKEALKILLSPSHNGQLEIQAAERKTIKIFNKTWNLTKSAFNKQREKNRISRWMEAKRFAAVKYGLKVEEKFFVRDNGIDCEMTEHVFDEMKCQSWFWKFYLNGFLKFCNTFKRRWKPLQISKFFKKKCADMIGYECLYMYA